MPDPTHTVFFLHCLGGSARTWSAVEQSLAGRVRCVALDLPGFGGNAGAGRSVAEMADAVAAAIRAAAPARWSLVGHSMGGKVAAVVARRAEDGEAGLAGLERLVLVAASPPGPEPMQDTQRAAMLGWFRGDAAQSGAESHGFIVQNASQALAGPAQAQAVADVLHADPEAWRAWLESGSREDWSGRVGLLRTPALVLAGGDDPELGAEGQRAHTLPHLAQATLVELPGVKHLLPYECPGEVARLIAGHLPTESSIPAGYEALIRSGRVSTQTREALLDRAAPDDPATQPAVLTGPGLAVLRAVLARVLPQDPAHAIDLAARLDAALHAGTGDGWRFADLPPDAEACRHGLAMLDQLAGPDGFVCLDAAGQDALLTRVVAGQADVPGGWTGLQMQRWCEDLRGEAVKLYVAHPRTLARIGYSGIGYGGDAEPYPGFQALDPGTREAWEPLPEGTP